MLTPRLGQRTLSRAVSVGVVCSIVSVAAVAFAADRLESLGIKAGMKRADVLAQITNQGISVREESAQLVSASGAGPLGTGLPAAQQ